MPAFAVLGGLVVFDWSRRLWGPWGGLISLALWTFCPNILAHARLVTTDVGATAIGFAATYAFWHYLRRPSWALAALAGLLLGIAQLPKFSLLLLYGLWPVLWLVDLARGRDGGAGGPSAGRPWQGVAMVALSVLVIDVGYGFEGVGKPLGSFPFASRTLTVDRDPPIPARPDPKTGRPKDLYAGLQQYRVNRFRDTFLGDLPAPLPEYYLRGFDDQKMEAEGIPARADPLPDRGPRARRRGRGGQRLPRLPRRRAERRELVVLLLHGPRLQGPGGDLGPRRGRPARGGARAGARARPVDEAALAAVPLVVLGVMSFATNIAIGLRYVLPIFPYAFVSAGRLARWAEGLGDAEPAARRGLHRPRPGGDRDGDGPDPPALPGVFQLGLGRGAERFEAPDRQQPRLGPGPRRPEGVARRARRRRAGRDRLLRADQPAGLRASGASR